MGQAAQVAGLTRLQIVKDMVSAEEKAQGTGGAKAVDHSASNPP